jgi:molybdopterin/thiamine biosynthesis adenylyltransferase
MHERYSRQIRFAPIGQAGQTELGKKHVLLVGAGALGTGNAEQLVRAGVGQLTIVDRDYVDESNLQRQQLYTEEDVRQHLPKAIALKRHLDVINSETHVIARVEDVSAEELLALAESVDLIIDATDNYETRFVINDVALKRNVPWIYGACLGSYGVSFMIIPGRTPCLNCLMSDIPLGGETCDTVGVIAPAVQMVVAHQSAEALKWLTGNHPSIRNRLVSYDIWHNTYTDISVDGLRKRDCPSCGEKAVYPYLSRSNLTRTAVLCGRDTVQVRPPRPTQLDLEALARQLRTLGGQVKANPYLVTYTNGSHRMVIFQDGRVLVHGTSDPVVARGLVNRYLGG